MIAKEKRPFNPLMQIHIKTWCGKPLCSSVS